MALETYRQLEIRRGNKANLPVLADGEMGFCEDTLELFVGTLGGNKSLGYVPMSPTNWVNPQPTTIQQALDRIAARVVALGGGPIP